MSDNAVPLILENADLRERVERLEAEMAGFPNLTALREAMIATADENSSLREQVRVLSEALKNVVEGNDLALERSQSLEGWRGSPFRKQAQEALWARKAEA